MTDSPSSRRRLEFPIRSVDELLAAESSPMLLPRIHSEVAEHILLEAGEHHPGKEFEIVFSVPAAEVSRLPEVRRAVRTFFEERARLSDQEYREKIRLGIKLLAVAMFLVALLVLLVEWLQAFGQGRLHRLFGESLVIIAWVTLWAPAELLIVEPFFLRRRRKLLLALSRADVSLDAR